MSSRCSSFEDKFTETNRRKIRKLQLVVHRGSRFYGGRVHNCSAEVTHVASVLFHLSNLTFVALQSFAQRTHLNPQPLKQESEP
jgi:hypothetical protein